MEKQLQFYRSSIRGVSLIELLAVIAIMSILAIVAAPMAEVMFYREKEIELKMHLRKIRESIDKYYSDHGRGVRWNIEYNRYWGHPDNAREDPNEPNAYSREETMRYQKMIWRGEYPTSWQALYSGYLRESYAVNPITKISEDWVIVVSYPTSMPFTMEISTGMKKYPVDFEYGPVQWHSETFFNADVLSGIFDIKYPYHDPSIDGASFYDAW
ncbi:type II secretion system protein [bacterium]|nr:type II secretion system protein [bacterium]